MRRIISLPVMASLSLLALPAIGQDDAGNVVRIDCVDVQPGAQARFEDGVKKHMDWHRKQKDTWGWAVWTVLTGPQTGRFCAGTFGHKWEDFDKPAVSMEADDADVQVNIAPFISSHEATFWALLPDLSRPRTEQAPMSSVVFHQIRAGMGDEFRSVVKAYKTAIEKADMPWRWEWYVLANGGEGGRYALVLPRASFATFSPSGKTLDEVLDEAYGKTAADALRARWTEVVKSTETSLIQGRPDLSYMPNP
jgi:hypothetical protein